MLWLKVYVSYSLFFGLVEDEVGLLGDEGELDVVAVDRKRIIPLEVLGTVSGDDAVADAGEAVAAVGYRDGDLRAVDVAHEGIPIPVAGLGRGSVVAAAPSVMVHADYAVLAEIGLAEDRAGAVPVAEVVGTDIHADGLARAGGNCPVAGESGPPAVGEIGGSDLPGLRLETALRDGQRTGLGDSLA